MSSLKTATDNRLLIEAQNYVNNDTPLSVLTWLNINDKKNRFPFKLDNDYSLQLALYCLSLDISLKTVSNINDINRILYETPTKLAEYISKNTKNEQYTRISQQLEKLREEQTINNIENGIDFTRFSSDINYRQSTIYGLFMTDKDI
ncbi:unnamed protein product, partial [Didymodactylos carnosus]